MADEIVVLTDMANDIYGVIETALEEGVDPVKVISTALIAVNRGSRLVFDGCDETTDWLVEVVKNANLIDPADEAAKDMN